MVRPSIMWGEDDVAFNSRHMASLYLDLGDWPHAAALDDRAATIFKDLVEHNPSVATFADNLVFAFEARMEAAAHENDRKQVAAWSKDALTFWNHLLELHPEMPFLKTYADDAAKNDAEVAQ